MPADALSRIRARGHIGIRLGLGRMRALLGRVGDPQLQLRGVLVGGTNGKGSVAAMTAAMLGVAGHTTGQSPSPHLRSYRERVTVDGRAIAADALDVLLDEVLAASEPGEREFGPATEFELMTAAAYLAAARAAVDVMVMEVGLGGRLDASNTWDPDVAAVTNVGLDHQEFLGDTLESVAAEKAAIIKAGARAVTGAHGTALQVVRERARSEGVPLDVCRPLPLAAMDAHGVVMEHPRLGRLAVPLLGRHQAGNAAVALGVVEALAVAGVAHVPDEAMRAGLAATRWPGRLELLDHAGCTVLVDGAHNPDGMAVLAATIDELAPDLPPGRATLLLGVMRDKEVGDMLDVLAGSRALRQAYCMATVVPETDRALAAAELARLWRTSSDGEAEACDDADEALERALERAADEDGLLVIAGSLYLVGHLHERLVPDAKAATDA